MKKSNFMEGAVIASFAIILTKIIGVLYVIPFYSIIGEQGGALYGYAYNIYNVFLIVSTAGIPLAISKITSEYNTLKKKKEKTYLYHIASKSIRIFSLLSFLLCFIFAKPLAHLIIGDITGGNTIQDVQFVIRCVSFALLVVPSLSIMRGYLQGHKYIAASSISQVVEQVSRVAVILGGSFLCLKVFHLKITTAVGVAVFGACIGALCAYFYLLTKSRGLEKYDKAHELNKNKKKEVIKKVISYILPFIMISVSGSLYNSTDMILLIRGLNNIGYNAQDIENISSIFTTWGNKLVSIVTALGTGVIMSLLPSIVSSYVKKDHDKVNTEFNKALQILFFIILPISCFASVFAREIWTIFYGANKYGPIVMRYLFVVAFFDASFTMTCSALQGMNKRRVIYTSVLIGLGLNAILDIPLIYLFDKLHIYPFYGAITATLIGYSLSLMYVLISLHKLDNLNYSDTFKKMPWQFLKTGLILSICFLISRLFATVVNRFYLILIVGVVGILFVFSYYLLNKKIINEMLGKDFFKKLLKK